MVMRPRWIFGLVGCIRIQIDATRYGGTEQGFSNSRRRPGSHTRLKLVLGDRQQETANATNALARGRGKSAMSGTPPHFDRSSQQEVMDCGKTHEPPTKARPLGATLIRREVLGSGGNWRREWDWLRPCQFALRGYWICSRSSPLRSNPRPPARVLIPLSPRATRTAKTKRPAGCCGPF